MFLFLIVIVAVVAENDFTSHKNFKLLPPNCGETNVTELVDGKAHLFEFQWAALLSYQVDTTPFRCSGSVINDRYILTTATCLQPPEKVNRVRVGELDISQNPDCEGAVCAPPYQDLQIEKTIPHPSYDRKTFSHDIALIRLSSKIENVKAVCLPLTPEAINYDFTNKKVLVSGWKIKGENHSEIELERSVRSYFPLDECKRIKVFKKSNFINQMCAGGQNQDTCFGISGGALYNTEDRNRLVQHGILSFGVSCESEKVPAVFTKILPYIQWILDTIKE